MGRSSSPIGREAYGASSRDRDRGRNSRSHDDDRDHQRTRYDSPDERYENRKERHDGRTERYGERDGRYDDRYGSYDDRKARAYPRSQGRDDSPEPDVRRRNDEGYGGNRSPARRRSSPSYDPYVKEVPPKGRRPPTGGHATANDVDDDEDLKGLDFSEYRRLKREKLRSRQAESLWEVTPSPTPSPERDGRKKEDYGKQEMKGKADEGREDSPREGLRKKEKEKGTSRKRGEVERAGKGRRSSKHTDVAGSSSEDVSEAEEEKRRRKVDHRSGKKKRSSRNDDDESSSGESSGDEESEESDSESDRRKKRKKQGTRRKSRNRKSLSEDSEDETGSDDSSDDSDSDEDRKGRKKRGSRRSRKEETRKSRRKERSGKKSSKSSRRSKKKRRKLESESDSSEASDSGVESDGEAEEKLGINAEVAAEGGIDDPAELDPDALSFKEYIEKQKRLAAADTLENEPIVGPAPAPKAEGNVKYGGAMRPGEGDAIAQYVQQGKRIPRRGEVGLSADEISRFETLGYVMSGSRHQRMNAIRIRKENQVYSAEDKRALAMFNYEEKAKREHKVMSDLQRLVERHMATDNMPVRAEDHDLVG